jgi:hypothetical protein
MTKVNLGYVFKTSHGKIMMEQEPRKDEKGNLVVLYPDTPNAQYVMDDTVPFILGEAIVRTLDNDAEIAKLDKKKKREVWHLTEKIIAAGDGEIEMSAEEIVMVGDALGRYYKASVAGQAMDILDPVAKETPTAPPAPKA